MRITTDALIIRENNNIGESDRFVTALTKDHGVVRASARGAQRIKSRNGPATQLLTHSRLTLYKGREKYIIDEAEPLHVFFDLRSDMDKLAVAQYFCELTDFLAPREETAEDWLRLLLNSLYLLGEQKYTVPHIKAVTEMRLLGLAGYMPDLSGCSGCGKAGDTPLFFSFTQGNLRCGDCTHPAGAAALSPTVLAALRHIVYTPLEKCFFFSIPDKEHQQLCDISEQFLLTQLGRGFHTLQFYHELQQPSFVLDHIQTRTQQDVKGD